MRHTQRYEAEIPCTIDPVEGGRQLIGMIRNLSLGGVGIDAHDEPPERFILSFALEDETVRLPCSTRHSRDLWSWRRVHTQFDNLTAQQEESLGRVLAVLQQAAVARQGTRLGVVGLARRILRR